jgi:hypothetical protein
MHKFFTSTIDASVYLQQPEQNAGRDEILEVGKLYYGSTKDIARTLIKFDTDTIKSELESNNASEWKIYLVLRSANSEEIPLEYTIYANAVSQSWSMGTGTKFDGISSDGVSWKYRDGLNSWQENTIAGTAVFTAGTTGSANAEGGTWYTASEASQSFNYELDDVRMDVTDIMELWIDNSLPNNGFIVHHSLENEANNLDYGLLKFFSKETNTIYEPKLELVWDDSVFNTGSLLPITSSNSADVFENSKIVVTNLQKVYNENTVNKIRIKGRDLYPAKSFTSQFEYDQSKYLPITSYYQIEDYRTDEVIIPFGEYSKLSCDSISNYFHLDTANFPLNRTYRLLIKVVVDGVTKIIDDKLIFDVV